MNILQNKAQCLICMDIIESTHRHDYKSCKCGNLAVDGGFNYIRRTFKDKNKIKELSEYTEDPIWISNKKALLIKDMSDDHLLNIVKDGYKNQNIIDEVIKRGLKWK